MQEALLFIPGIFSYLSVLEYGGGTHNGLIVALIMAFVDKLQYNDSNIEKKYNARSSYITSYKNFPQQFPVR